MNILSNIGQAGFNLGQSLGQKISDFIYPTSRYLMNEKWESSIIKSMGEAEGKKYIADFKKSIEESNINMFAGTYAEITKSFDSVKSKILGVTGESLKWIAIVVTVFLAVYIFTHRRG